MPAWLDATGIILATDGSVILCDTCPCSVLPCEFCSGTTPDSFDLAISGAVDGSCAECEWWNTHSFVIEHDVDFPATGCSWTLIFDHADYDWSCEPTGSSNFLIQATSTTFTITLNLTGGGAVIWK